VNRNVVTATDQKLSCGITGLSASTSVTWVDTDNLSILDTDTENYSIDQGSYSGGSKTSTLTIKKAKLDTFTAGQTYNYKCKLKSAQYPDDSPFVINPMVLTILELGKWVTGLRRPFNISISVHYLELGD
jgi:hypothetical protein